MTHSSTGTARAAEEFLDANPQASIIYHAFFEYAEDSLCEVEVTPDGRFICGAINPHAEAVMGIDAKSIRGKTAIEILGAEAGARINAALARCLAEARLRYEETWPTVRGPRVTDTIMIALPGQQGGRTERILCSMRDITDRRDLQRRLAQAQKVEALGQLAAGVAHDVNNVLQVIEGAAALIKRRPASAVRFADVVLSAVGRAAAIVHRLLAFARCDELRSQPLQVTGLLTELEQVLSATLGSNIAICCDVDPQLPLMRADRGQLQTALINLATNARDAMPGGGTLTLRARLERVEGDMHPVAGLQPGEYVRLDVVDTGLGMDKTTLSRAAEPFFTTKPIGKGTGLGLAMVRGFAEQSGGAFALSSHVGKGTTVSLWFPTQQASEPSETTRDDANPAIAVRADARSRVLLVDDDELVRETLTWQLEDAGHEVHCAENAAVALAWLEAGNPTDVLLSDLCMPGIDGLTLIEQAQQQRPGLSAILMTGYAGSENASDLDANGAGRFRLLRKPIATRALLAELAWVRRTDVPAKHAPEGDARRLEVLPIQPRGLQPAAHEA